MSQVIHLKEVKNDFSTNIEKLLNLCKIDIEEINRLIIEKLDSSVPLIREMASYVLLSGGKRLRPLLTVTCAKITKNFFITKP